MQYKLISLLPLQLARIVGLVRTIEPVELADELKQWVLLIRGRGFTRLLRDEALVAPNLLRPIGWDAPKPITFRRRDDAEAYGRHMGLLPQRTRWAVRSGRPGTRTD